MEEGQILDTRLQLWGQELRALLCEERSLGRMQHVALWEVQISRNQAPLANTFKVISIR